MQLLTAEILPARARILAVALVLMFSSQTTYAGDEFAIKHQGIARPYLLHRPSNNEFSPRPLVIYLHGLRPADWKNHTKEEIDTAADRWGFVAVYPEAVDRRWNYTGSPGEPVQAQGKAVADIGFISKLIDELVGRKVAMGPS